MAYYLTYYSYMGSILFASIFGIYRFKYLDTPSKILTILICCDLANEIAAYYLSMKYHNNLPLYNVYCLLEFGILSIYFNELIDIFKKINLGLFIGLLGIVLGIINIFIQGINSLNFYFLFFEDLSIIGMSLFAFFRLLLKNDSLNLYKYPHFWTLSILLFFWSTTFLFWGLFEFVKKRAILANVETIEFTIGIITYIAFALVFLFYPKMKQGHD